MKTNTYTEEIRTLRVSGRLWSGAQCQHSYPILYGDSPTTLEDAKRLAGDFESLDRASVVKTVRVVKETRTATTLHAIQSPQREVATTANL